MFPSEDVTIGAGAWMLAMNVNFENNKLLCETNCSLLSIVVTDFPRRSGGETCPTPVSKTSSIKLVSADKEDKIFTQQRELMHNLEAKRTNKQDIHWNYIMWSSQRK